MNPMIQLKKISLLSLLIALAFLVIQVIPRALGQRDASKRSSDVEIPLLKQQPAPLEPAVCSSWTAHGQPQHRTRSSHGDLAAQRDGAGCRGIGSGGSSRERGTVRPGERDLDCHGQPQHRARSSHGDLAAQRDGAGCRGIQRGRRSPRARNCTTRRAGPGRPRAASTPRALSTRRPCCPTGWCWLQGEVVAALSRARNCTTRRAGLGRPRAASTPRAWSHGDLAAQRDGAGCRGI